MTAATFSVLDTVTAIGWSKQHVVLASVASFIMGGVVGGSLIGLVGLTQQSEQSVVLTVSSPLASTQTTTQSIAQTHEPAFKKIMEGWTAVNPVVASVSRPITPPNQVTKPQRNPLASFTPSTQNTEQKTTTGDYPFKRVTQNDDWAMQRLIKNQSLSTHSEVGMRGHKPPIDNEKIDKTKIEAAFKAELPIKNMPMHKEANSSPVKLPSKAKNNNARDKDVLLVKSMLDTMDHPTSTAKKTPIQ